MKQNTITAPWFFWAKFWALSRIGYTSRATKRVRLRSQAIQMLERGQHAKLAALLETSSRRDAEIIAAVKLGWEAAKYDSEREDEGWC